MTTEIHHGPVRCKACEDRQAAEVAAAEKAHLVASLSDAALAALADAIQNVQREMRPPA